MNSLKNAFKFYINSNIHVAFAGYCLTKITLLEFGLFGRVTPVFVALLVLISYNFIRYVEIKTERLFWFKKWFEINRNYLLFLVIAAFVGLVDLILKTNFNKASLLILFPFGFVTFFYAVPLGKIGNYIFSFRNFPGIKIFSIALTWAGITVFFPLFEKGISFNTTVYAEFIQRFLFLIALTIPFDIRDMENDTESLQTIPILVGVESAKYIGYILLLSFILLELIKRSFNSLEFLVVILTALITGLFLRFTTTNQTRFYTGFWVEAIPVFWLIIYSVFLNFKVV